MVISSCAVYCAWVTAPAVPSPFVLLAACTCAVGVWVPPHVALPSPPGGGDWPRADANSLRSSDARTNLRVVRSLAFELAFSVGRLRLGPRPATQPMTYLLATSVATQTVSYLYGCLPLAERAAACSGLGGDLALDCLPPRGRARRCPKLRKTCALSVWMRSVDDWPLAKILVRFPGVSRGR